MNEKSQIIFMQVRMLRLAAATWNISIKQVMNLFIQYGVLEYIEAGYGIFHCEGDEAILEDISKLLTSKGMKFSA